MDINDVEKILSVTNFKSKTHFPLHKDVSLLPKLNVKQMLSKHVLPKGLEAKFYKSDNITTVSVEQILSNPPTNLNTFTECNPTMTHYFRDMKSRVNYSKEKHRKGYYIDLFADLIKCGQDATELGNGLKITTPQTDFIGKHNVVDIECDYSALKNIEDEDKSSSESENSDDVTSDEEDNKCPPSDHEKKNIPDDIAAVKPKPLTTPYEHCDIYFSKSSDEDEFDMQENYDSQNSITVSDTMDAIIFDPSKTLAENIRNIITRIPESESILYKVDKTISTRRYISIVTYHNLYPDASVTFGNTTYKCQMHVLRNSAFYFAKRVSQRIYKMPNIGGIDILFRDIYNYMLIGKIKISVRKLLKIFIISRTLEMNSLASSLWGHLELLVSSYEYGSLLIYLNAIKNKIDHIKYVLVNKIRVLFLKFVSSIEFRKLTDCEVCTLLSSDSIGVNSEMEVFYSMILWLEYDWQNRKKYVARLLECIRFRLMDLEFLPRLGFTNRNKIVKYVLNATRESELMSENVIYWAVRKMDAKHEFDFPGCTREFKKLERPRLWIFNREISYHHKHHCPLYVPITYFEFKLHLIKIQNEGNESPIEIIKDPDNSCCVYFSEEVNETNLYTSQTEEDNNEDESERDTSDANYTKSESG